MSGTLSPEDIEKNIWSVPYSPWRSYYKGILKCLKEHHSLTIIPQATDENFVFIIDEINRGDISKILGELFYAIDDGYRGPKGCVKTQYQNLIEGGDPFYNGFYVPENVYIIGTMNDIDRNVESMDFAIRRRFTWEEIKPKDRFDAMMNGLKSLNGGDVPDDIVDKAKECMVELNKAISDNKNSGLGSAYQIGPAYFKKITNYLYDDDPFEGLWKHHLEPLLCEYLRGMPNSNKMIEEVLKPAYDLRMLDKSEALTIPEQTAD